MPTDPDAIATPLPPSPDALAAALRDSAGYFATDDLATILFVAAALGRPVLLEGPPGVGKTAAATALAEATGRRLVRLQCYEGLDESRALFEWSYARQLLFVQLLRETLARRLEPHGGDVRAAMDALRADADTFFSEDFLLERPLLAALRSPTPCVLLVDEVDRADEEFEAFLLEILGEGQVTIPELGTLRARHAPVTVLTSNASRRLSDALRRRCLYAWLDFPSLAQEVQIVARRVPGLEAELRRKLVLLVRELRELELRKPPSIAETLDWAAVLLALGARDLDRATVRRTLGAALKNREDLERVLERYR